MAGNGAIQFLRGTHTNIENHADDILLEGQPLYDTTNNALYIGDGSTTLGNLSAIGGNHLYHHSIVYACNGDTSSTGYVFYITFDIYDGNSTAYTQATLYNLYGYGATFNIVSGNLCYNGYTWYDAIQYSCYTPSSTQKVIAIQTTAYYTSADIVTLQTTGTFTDTVTQVF